MAFSNPDTPGLEKQSNGEKNRLQDTIWDGDDDHRGADRGPERGYARIREDRAGEDRIAYARVPMTWAGREWQARNAHGINQ